MIQIHFNFFSENFLEPCGGFDLNLFGTQRKSFVTTPCTGSELNNVACFQFFFKGFLCTFPDDIQNPIDVRFTFNHRRKRFQTETSGEHIFHLFQFPGRKNAVFQFSDENTPADTLKNQSCNSIILT